MATPPTHATVATQSPLLQMVEALNNCAAAIDELINAAPDPLSDDCEALRRKQQQIVSRANDIRARAMADISAEIETSIGTLKAAIDKANQTIRDIAQARRVIAIAGSVLSAAAKFAVGGPIAAAPEIPGLVQAIGEAVVAAQAEG